MGRKTFKGHSAYFSNISCAVGPFQGILAPCLQAAQSDFHLLVSDAAGSEQTEIQPGVLGLQVSSHTGLHCKGFISEQKRNIFS